MKKNCIKFIVVGYLLSFLLSNAIGQGYEIKSFPFDIPLNAVEIFVEGDTIWIGHSQGAARFANNGWEFFNKTNGLDVDSVYYIEKDTQGALWFMGTNGVAKYQEGVWTKYFDGISDNYGTLSVTGDLLWMKYNPLGWYNDSGLYKISTTDTTYVGLYLEEVFRDQTGKYWGYSKLFSRLYYSENAQVWSDTLIIYSGISDFYIDKDNNQWLAAGTTLYLRKYGEQPIQFDEFNAIETPIENFTSITYINGDTRGNLYVGTTNGVYIKTKNEWIHLNKSNGLIGEITKNIEVDKSNNIWVTCTSEESPAREASGVSVITGNGFNFAETIGTIYADANHNGIQNDGEPGIPNLLIQLTEEGHYAVTDTEGKFSFSPATGENTITVKLKSFWEEGADPLTYTFTHPDETPEFSIGLKWKEVHDVAVFLNTTAARPGFDTRYSLQLRNEGSVTENIELKLQYNPVLNFISSTEEPTTTSEGEMIFNFADINAQQGKIIDMTFNLPANVALGTELTSKVTVSALAGETDLTDNMDSLKVIVTGSFDPNDKLVREGIKAERFVELGKYLTYTIRFQNTGTDYAFNIKIQDDLDPHFDLNTLEVLSASHPVTSQLNNHTLTFTFADIMLPDSIHNEPASHGYVRYRIKPLTATLNNTVVVNSAAIYFDFNEAVVTNEVSNTLVTTLPKEEEVLGAEDDLKGKLFYPNPVSNRTIHLKEVARGYQSVELVSLNGATLQRFDLGPNQDRLHLEVLQPGVYLLKFADQKKITVAKLIISQ